MKAKHISPLGAALLLSLLLSSHLVAEDLYKRIPQAEAVADVQQFFSTLQRVHPDLLAKVSLEDYIKLKQQTLENVAKKLDKDGKISINNLAYILCYAAAFFRDGHTVPYCWWITAQTSGSPFGGRTGKESGTRFPPFLLVYDNGRFIVTSSSDKGIEGLEIVSIEGTPIQEFLRPVLDRCSAETLAWKTSIFTKSQTFWYAFCNLCGSAGSLTLKLRDINGKESERKVQTVGVDDFEKLSLGARATKLEQLRRQGTQVSFVDSGKIAYFLYPGFNYSDDEKKKIDSIFHTIKDKGSKDLIIDLRGNGGGASPMGCFIISYIHEGEFHEFSKIRVKVSQDMLSPSEYLLRMWRSREDADFQTKVQEELVKRYAGLEGMVVTEQGQDESVPKPDAFFSGRVFLLVDNGTFSSAVGFATIFRDYGMGTILGYETGGIPIQFGNQLGFMLEHSNIQCGVSWKQFFPSKPRPGDDEHGIIPDIPMNDKLLRPYQKEDDPVLAFTLDHIKKTRQKAEH